jgi:hypothetical protein
MNTCKNEQKHVKAQECCNQKHAKVRERIQKHTKARQSLQK